MSAKQSNRLFLILAALAALTSIVFLLTGCNIQPPTNEQPKEESPVMVGVYPSPYDTLTRENDAYCNDLLMTFKGEAYIVSNDTNTVSAYMNPCYLKFMAQQPKEMKDLIVALTSSATREETRLTATQMSSEDGHSLIELRNEKLNIDVFVRTKAPEILPQAKGFDGSYDRKKLTMPVPDFVDQIAQKLINQGYKFNNAKAGLLQFETGSLEAESGYGTAAIMFDPASK